MEKIVLLVYFVSLCVLFAFGIHGLVLLYFYKKTSKKKAITPAMPDEMPMVTIQLPLFNEYYVVERLIRSVCAIKYPKDKLEIQVLDDSTDDSVALSQAMVKEYADKGFDIKYIHRTDRTGYKAGALKNGLITAKGEFVAIFDADFVPNEDFLLKTVPHFANPKLGLVQTRWEHLNEDHSFITKAQALALDSHFVLEQQSRNKAGFFIGFNGTAGIWRKETIFDAGNWHADTLAEDLDLSYRAQLKGWKFLYLNDVTSPAELPTDINALKTQQFRWTKGYVETALKVLPSVMKAKLSWKVKAECFIHLTANFVFPFIILVAMLNLPILLIKNYFSGYDTFYSMMSIFVLASVASFLFYTYAQKAIHLDWRKRLLMFPLFMAGSMGLAINNSKAVFEAVMRKKTGFVRTAKAGDVPNSDLKKKYAQKKKVSPVIFVELLFAAYFLLAIGVSVWHLELAAIPFQLMFLLGFGSIGYLSLKSALSH